MPILRKLTTHRSWEDWLLLALGIFILLSPSFTDGGYHDLPASALIVGIRRSTQIQALRLGWPRRDHHVLIQLYVA